MKHSLLKVYLNMGSQVVFSCLDKMCSRMAKTILYI